jgi:SAM-dependent methyltransferase
MFSIDRNLMRKISSFWFFDRWHPEVALRYLPIVDEIRRYKKCTVLDVGSAGLGIAPYLKREVQGLDVDFKPPYCNLLKRKIGSILLIPYNNNSFDFVICVDMLEHISPDKRRKAISELIRVAKYKIAIAVPCGGKAQKQDEWLDLIYEQKYGEMYHFLNEQIEYGLPLKKDIIEIVQTESKKLHKRVQLHSFGNENLRVHEFLMKGWMTKNLILNIFYRKILLLFIPILRLFNQEPCYRQIFIISLQHENSN